MGTILTRKELARALKCSVASVDRWRRRWRRGVYRSGGAGGRGRVTFCLEEILEQQEERRRL